jgi:hypothetical protein
VLIEEHQTAITCPLYSISIHDDIILVQAGKHIAKNIPFKKNIPYKYKWNNLMFFLNTNDNTQLSAVYPSAIKEQAYARL